jgi:hypothetical protein
MGRSDYAMSRLFRPPTHLLCLFLSLSLYINCWALLLFLVYSAGEEAGGRETEEELHPDCVFLARGSNSFVNKRWVIRNYVSFVQQKVRKCERSELPICIDGLDFQLQEFWSRRGTSNSTVFLRKFCLVVVRRTELQSFGVVISAWGANKRKIGIVNWYRICRSLVGVSLLGEGKFSGAWGVRRRGLKQCIRVC